LRPTIVAKHHADKLALLPTVTVTEWKAKIYSNPFFQLFFKQGRDVVAAVVLQGTEVHDP
jgi:hypothetical protein